MDSFQWNDTFVTGHKEIDEQHFYLVELINNLGELVTENKASLDKVNEVYKQLESYAVYHFQEEEQLMRDVGIDDEFVAIHINVHETFLKQIVMMHEQLSADDLSSIKHLLDFLVNWLIFHILGMDKNLGRQIKKIESGMPARQAYQSEIKTNDSATEALLSALNNLFTEVALRNEELVSLNQTLENKVLERTSELQLLNENLKHLSITDQLTNLPNRRFAISHLQALWTKSISQNKPLSCLMIDVDKFKLVNDTYGHDAGDKVLVELTQKIRQTLRNDDIVCRLGGDEFFVICEDTDLKGAQHVAQLLSDAVKTLVVAIGSHEWLGSISIGVATKLATMEQFEELIKKADQGVYLAKQAGQGCVQSA